MKVYTYNDKVLTNSANGKWLKKYVDPYNPLGLPPFTIRIKLRSGSSAPSVGGATVTPVTGQTDVYDVCTAGDRNGNWSGLLASSALVEVLGANATGVTSTSSAFVACRYLTTLPLFDTSSVTNMGAMCQACQSLTSIPLFDTSSVTAIDYAFMGCNAVESGALALYQQLSTQATPPSYHNNTFSDCGSNTVTGAAELAQIPSEWGGTGA